MEQIKIDIVPVGVAPVAHASQFDMGRQIRFNLFNQGAAYTLTGAETVTMVVNSEEESITNTSDNYVVWDVADGDCETAGVIGCELRIVLGSMLIGSRNFFLEVEMDPYGDSNLRIVTVGPADICTFETNLPEPLQSVLVNVLATGGNGTPDNPNPINGYTEANITANGDVITIAFGQTVYGGVLDVTRGKLNVTHGSKLLNDNITWTLSAQGYWYTTALSNAVKRPPNNATKADALAEQYAIDTFNNVYTTTPNTIGIQSNGTVAVYNGDSVNTPQGLFIYALATPFDIDLTPEVISAVVGVNNVFADCGQTEVKYLTIEV